MNQDFTFWEIAKVVELSKTEPNNKPWSVQLINEIRDIDNDSNVIDRQIFTSWEILKVVELSNNWHNQMSSDLSKWLIWKQRWAQW